MGGPGGGFGGLGLVGAAGGGCGVGAVAISEPYHRTIFPNDFGGKGLELPGLDKVSNDFPKSDMTFERFSGGGRVEVLLSGGSWVDCTAAIEAAEGRGLGWDDVADEFLDAHEGDEE